jgi:hypothetical protein
MDEIFFDSAFLNICDQILSKFVTDRIYSLHFCEIVLKVTCQNNLTEDDV